MSKVEIVIDADVLIHFSRGSCLSLLPEIFPEFLSDVISQGSKLPLIDFSTYVSPVQM